MQADIHADMLSIPSMPVAESANTRAAGLTIADGDGWHLALDLRCAELRWVADACRRLVGGTLPGAASAIKVRAGEKCYLLNTTRAMDGDERITLLNLFDPGERVALTRDVAAIVATLIEDGVTRQA